MFQSYSAIFDQRGHDYHAAMERCPTARVMEFRYLIELANLGPGLTIADMPAGGGYLAQALTTELSPSRLAGLTVVPIETCVAFAQVRPLPVPVMVGVAGEGLRVPSPLLCESLAAIALPSASLDRILSLAGLHHISDRLPVYHEAYRLLRPGGVFCLADVWAGSAVGAFLNGFVDQHSHFGHQGDFLSFRDLQALTHVGFELNVSRAITYPWYFQSAWEMVEFCRLLFGIDRAHPEEILTGISTYLGYHEQGSRVSLGRCEMTWELYFIQAIKPDL